MDGWIFAQMKVFIECECCILVVAVISPSRNQPNKLTYLSNPEIK